MVGVIRKRALGYFRSNFDSTVAVNIAKADIVRKAYEHRSTISANVIDVRGNRRAPFVNHSDAIGLRRC